MNDQRTFSRQDLLDLRREKIRERRVKQASAVSGNILSFCRTGKEAVKNLYMPPEYPKIA